MNNLSPPALLLKPPFSASQSPLLNIQSPPVQIPQPLSAAPRPPTPILPGVYHDRHNDLQEVDDGVADSVAKFIEWELNVSRLNKIHKYLWLAGRPMCARALHRQVMLGREIVIAEQADLHLVWQESRLFLKPLPEFLMDHEFWKDHICKSEALYESARGFLLSYIWLICHPSDLKIAQDKGLLTLSITWERWTTFGRCVLQNIDHTSLFGVNPRYHYGELRLSRLNWIYRLSPNTVSFSTFIRGYMYGYNRYSVFVQRNFAWLVVAFVYITIVLTAMQVGLATDRFSHDPRFQNASYGFTIFSILVPLIGIVVIASVLFGLALFHLLATISFKRTVEKRRQTLVRNQAAKVP